MAHLPVTGVFWDQSLSVILCLFYLLFIFFFFFLHVSEVLPLLCYCFNTTKKGPKWYILNSTQHYTVYWLQICGIRIVWQIIKVIIQCIGFKYTRRVLANPTDYRILEDRSERSLARSPYSSLHLWYDQTIFKNLWGQILLTFSVRRFHCFTTLPWKSLSQESDPTFFFAII